MNEIQVSVIIPAYNCVHTLTRAAESILNQTLGSSELIIVNDGSSDGTAEICRRIAASDSRVAVIDKENGGAASARNAGIDASHGEYLFFLDADDYLENDALDKMLTCAVRNSSDIVCCAVNIVTEGRIRRGRCGIDGLYCDEKLRELYRMMCVGKPDAAVTMVNKLYRTELIKSNGIRLPEIVSGEDALFSFDCMALSKRIFFMNDAGFYNYVMQMSSFTHKAIPIRERVRQSDEFFRLLEDRIDRYFSSDMHGECIRALDSRRAVSLYSFAAEISLNTVLTNKEKLGELEYTASLDNYSPALSPAIYHAFPINYRLVLEALSRGKYKRALYIMNRIQRLKRMPR